MHCIAYRLTVLLLLCVGLTHASISAPEECILHIFPGSIVWLHAVHKAVMLKLYAAKNTL